VPLDGVALTFAGFGGVRLAGDRRGDPAAPPVLFLHGGGQTRHSWAGSAQAVADRGWQAVTVDSRGHGESDWAPDQDYRLTSFAADIVAVTEALLEPPVLVGASLGGMSSILALGELAPGCARGLVLVDIIPAMEPAGAERIQTFMQANAASGFGSLEEVADAVAAYNPHRRRPADLAGLQKNVRLRDGRWYWHWDPVFIGGGHDRRPNESFDQGRLEDDVASILDAGVAMLLVRGRASDLVSQAAAEAFVTRFPAVELVDVSGAGHMVAGDRNDAFTDAVVDFLERHRP
jgi:pimeloyl-ACP methyl ester carboxylesterase